MSEFIRSTQATNSPRSVGRFGSRTRWMATPPTISSAGDSSPPRVSTWTSTPSSTSASESLRTWRASPPSISGGYSQERIRTRVTGRRSCSGLAAAGRGSGPGRGFACAGPAAGGSLWPRAAPAAWAVGALEGVVAGLAAAVEERPVARLEREQLARGALGGRRRRARPRRAPAAGAAPAAARPRRGRRPPASPRCAGPCPRPRSTRAAARLRRLALERLGQGHAGARRAPARSRRTAAQPDRPLRPPVAEQLGVDREGEQAAAARGARERQRSRSATAAANSRGLALGASARPPPGRRLRRRSSRGASRAATCRWNSA